jgi:predicted Fe-S protein YdhL (DUF1289 family)
MAMPSPYIDICRFDRQTGYCVACRRTAKEASRWPKMTDHQRRRILEDNQRRRAKLSRADAVTP